MRPIDQAKFYALYEAHHAAVQRCVASLGLPRYLWQDIVQDVWITALHRFDTLVAHPRPVGWLCTVVRNSAMHYVRGHLRRQNKHQALAAEPSRTTDDPVGERDAWDTLARLLTRCPLEQREVYLKIELYGMTANEVAEELGLSVNTVYSRLRKAREHLRESGAALAAVLLLLRTRLVHAVPAELQVPIGDALAALGPAANAAQTSRASGAAGKLALVALLILPASSSRQVEEVPAVGHAASGSFEELDSVHHERPWIPWAPPSPSGTSVALAPASDLPPPQPGARAVRGRGARPAAAPPQPGVVPREDGEDLYRAAREAYRAGRYERALDAALRHRARFPTSQLGDSRELLVAQVYCALGREADARAQVRSFALEAPEKGAHRARLARLPEECR